MEPYGLVSIKNSSNDPQYNKFREMLCQVIGPHKESLLHVDPTTGVLVLSHLDGFKNGEVMTREQVAAALDRADNSTTSKNASLTLRDSTVIGPFVLILESSKSYTLLEVGSDLLSMLSN